MKREGAALVIVLGFLAILTVLVIAFTAHTRTERLAGRAYLDTAQTRHLLHAALARAMEDIDDAFGGATYPTNLALHSTGDVAGSFYFDVEEDYLPLGNDAISDAYEAALDQAEWQAITAGTSAVGRIGYIVVNTSGLLDANSVGGDPRDAGLSPREIQLSGTANTIAADRDTKWRRYETLRDLRTLNGLSSIADFSTFSFSPPGDTRLFMGTNSATLNVAALRDELKKIDAIPDPEFVLNQLRDYLDTDTLPEDENGDYTDLSVEPVPMVNELVLTCDFTFFPQLEEIEDEASGEMVMEVTSVVISNRYSLAVEVWYPFVGYINPNSYSMRINDLPLVGEQIIDEEEFYVPLLGDVLLWTGAFDIPETATIPYAPPHDSEFFSSLIVEEATSSDDLIALFASMAEDIQFPLIACEEESGTMVDRVLQLELPLQTAVLDELVPDIQNMASNLFAITAVETSNRFIVGMACIDPRLNWDGTSTNQWKEAVASGETATADTLGEINLDMIALIETPDPTNIVFVRNEDRIDTPFELTYLLYDENQPWKTFQFIEANDNDGTRFILENLSPCANGPPPSGRINPYSPHTNVLAAAFLDMPLDEFNNPATKRMDADQAKQAAVLFMEQVAKNQWPANGARCSDGMAYGELTALVRDDNPWVAEAFFRNTYELFNPRDTLYTILLVAQGGTDADGDGGISDDEVRSTQQAVAYVWRDPDTEKAAVVFWGLSDTLQSSIGSGGATWSSILDAFKP